MLPGLISLDFYYDIQMVRSEFVIYCINPWIQLAPGRWWYNGVSNVFFALNYCDCLRAALYLSIVADYLDPFLVTNSYFMLKIHYKAKTLWARFQNHFEY